jgi:hypothetical protein
MKRVTLLLSIAAVVLTYCIFSPFSSHITRALPNVVDPLFYAWNLFHNVQSAAQGFNNLLNTNIFYPEGNTLAFSDTLYAQTILTAPIIVFTKNPILAENLYILATFPLAAVSMFFLSYYLTRQNWASALAGLFFAFSYPRISQLGHMPAISSQWLPLCFLYLIKYIREGKRIDLAMLLFWYIVSTASTIYFGVFLIPLLCIVFLTEIFGKPINRIFHIGKDFLILVLPFIAFLIIILFPYIRLRVEYPDIKRNLEDSAKLSAVPIDYISVLPTSWLGDIGLPVNTNEHPLYPTMTVLVLGIISIFLVDKKNRKGIIAFGFVTLIALFLSFGPFASIPKDSIHSQRVNLPYYYLYKVFPPLQSIRVPARFSIFVILGLSVLSSYSLSKILTHPRHSGIGILLTLLFLTEIWQIHTPAVTVPLWNEVPPAYHFINTQPDDSIIVELPVQLESNGLTMDDQLMRSYDALGEQDTYALESYRTYFSAFHRKRMLNGYSGFFPNVYHEHVTILSNFPSQQSVDLLQKAGVRYILVHGSQYPGDRFPEIEQEIRNYPSLKLLQHFGSDYIYTIKP